MGAMNKSTSIEPGTSTLAYQPYVELEWIQPKGWRRRLVLITINLPLLRATLPFRMGWPLDRRWHGSWLSVAGFVDLNSWDDSKLPCSGLCAYTTKRSGLIDAVARRLDHCGSTEFLLAETATLDFDATTLHLRQPTTAVARPSKRSSRCPIHG